MLYVIIGVIAFFVGYFVRGRQIAFMDKVMAQFGKTLMNVSVHCGLKPQDVKDAEARLEKARQEKADRDLEKAEEKLNKRKATQNA